MSSQRRYLYLVPLFIGLCALIGGVFGPGAEPVAAAAQQSVANTSDADIKGSLESFTRVYDIVEQNSAEKLTPDKAIYQGAIPGMLRTLDPHSNFFGPKAYAHMREEQHGTYFGIGAVIGPQPRTGKSMIIRPMGGSPAYKAGLRPGDIILKVNSTRVDNKTTTEVANLLKGPKGTKVQVTVSREGDPQPITFNLVRAEIPYGSVDKAFWVKPGIAYLHITSFSDTNTFQEVNDNLRRLGEKNIQGLILDLRENPGGLLHEGVSVAGRWLDPGQVVVSHKGRVYPDQAYRAHGSKYGESYPIVVLVDRYTASAAEIVSGALQDHDRAWLLGETTFGKGLVQTVYPLSDHTGLALTTQHYFTPSGRLIQRDYSHISFLDYYYGDRSNKPIKSELKETDLGRPVYGGGGITPDEKFQEPKLDAFQMNTENRNAFFDFSAYYFSNHSTKLPHGWIPPESVMNSFHDYLMKEKVPFTEADWTRDHSWMRNHLRAQMYVTAFGYESKVKLDVEQDPEIAAAIEAMPKAAHLLAESKAHFERERASLR